MELSVAFAAVTKKDGAYRHFYTGVEPVSNGRYELLLVTLDKGDVKHEHLQYADFPLGERLFQWQSKANTRADGEHGRRHGERAPPVEGAANKQLVDVLAKYLSLPRRQIEIVSGENARYKRVRIGTAAETVTTRLAS